MLGCLLKEITQNLALIEQWTDRVSHLLCQHAHTTTVVAVVAVVVVAQTRSGTLW